MEIENENNINSVNNPEIIELIHKARIGDELAFKKLMKKYYKSVYYMIYKILKNEHDTEDVTIEVFTKVFYNLDMYSETHSFSTWLFKIASNHAIDFLRKQKFKKNEVQIDKPISDEEGDWFMEIPSNTHNPEESLIRKQNQQKILELIEILPEDLKQIIRLRFIEGLSYKDIAEKLNQPLGTVKARIFRGRNLLISMLNKKL